MNPPTVAFRSSNSSSLRASTTPRALVRALSARSPINNNKTRRARASNVVFVEALSSRSSSSSSSPSSSSTSKPEKPRGESGLDIAGSRPTSPKAWEEIKRTLKEANATFLSPQEVVFARDKGKSSSLPSLLAEPLQALSGYLSGGESDGSSSKKKKKSSSSGSGGALILDIRPPNEFAKGHIPGAVNVPLYRPITGLSPRAIARRAVFAFFGVLNGTESNPDFIEQATRALERASNPTRVVTVCNLGGSFSSETNARGTQSRSVSAAYELVRAGVCGGSSGVRVDMLKGGYYEWVKSEREVVIPEK